MTRFRNMCLGDFKDPPKDSEAAKLIIKSFNAPEIKLENINTSYAKYLELCKSTKTPEKPQ